MEIATYAIKVFRERAFDCMIRTYDVYPELTPMKKVVARFANIVPVDLGQKSGRKITSISTSKPFRAEF